MLSKSIRIRKSSRKSSRKNVRKNVRKSSRKSSRKNSRKNSRKSSRKSSRKNVRKSKKNQKNDGSLQPFLAKLIEELQLKLVVDTSEYEKNKVIKLTFNESIYDMVEIIPHVKYRIGLNIIKREMGKKSNDVFTDMSNKIYDSLYNVSQNKYALIYCHRRKWNDDTPHFLKNRIQEYCEKNNKEKKPIIYLTIDILEGGDFQNDGFSEEFINSYKESCDFVFIPDCDGIWGEAYKSESLDKFQKILSNVSSLLKKDGQLLFSKIPLSLEKHFEKVEKDKYDEYDTINFYKFL